MVRISKDSDFQVTLTPVRAIPEGPCSTGRKMTKPTYMVWSVEALGVLDPACQEFIPMCKVMSDG